MVECVTIAWRCCCHRRSSSGAHLKSHGIIAIPVRCRDLFFHASHLEPITQVRREPELLPSVRLSVYVQWRVAENVSSNQARSSNDNVTIDGRVPPAAILTTKSIKIAFAETGTVAPDRCCRGCTRVEIDDTLRNSVGSRWNSGRHWLDNFLGLSRLECVALNARSAAVSEGVHLLSQTRVWIEQKVPGRSRTHTWQLSESCHDTTDASIFASLCCQDTSRQKFITTTGVKLFQVNLPIWPVISRADKSDSGDTQFRVKKKQCMILSLFLLSNEVGRWNIYFFRRFQRPEDGSMNLFCTLSDQAFLPALPFWCEAKNVTQQPGMCRMIPINEWMILPKHSISTSLNHS